MSTLDMHLHICFDIGFVATLSASPSPVQLFCQQGVYLSIQIYKEERCDFCVFCALETLREGRHNFCGFLNDEGREHFWSGKPCCKFDKYDQDC